MVIMRILINQNKYVVPGSQRDPLCAREGDYRQGYARLMAGISHTHTILKGMACVWYVYGMCMVCVWYVYGMCMANACLKRTLQLPSRFSR